MVWKSRITILTLIMILAVVPVPAKDAGKVYLRNATLDAQAVGKALGDRAELTLDRHERAIWLLHFTECPARTERDAVEGTGGMIIAFIHSNSYLVRATAEVAAELAALPGVDMIREYDSAWKIEPGMERSGEKRLVLSFVQGSGLVDLVDRISSIGGVVRATTQVGQQSRIGISIEAEAVEQLAQLPGLLWIAEPGFATDRNDDINWACQSHIPNYQPFWERGIHGEGQILGHIDSGFSWNECWFYDPEGDPIGPDHRKVQFLGAYFDSSSSSSHGTHTAGILVGNGYHLEASPADTLLRSLAYRARISSSKYNPDLTIYDYYNDLMLHHESGAHIHSNSWGSYGVNLDYLNMCVDIDQFSWDYEDDFVLVATINGECLSSPENAKNSLAVGNGKLVGDFYSNPPVVHTDSRQSGGMGPTADGRRKPDLYAPGYRIDSASRSYFCTTRSSTGTSMACPAVAATGALARQYFIEGFYPSGIKTQGDGFTPSGALMRAVLINSSFEMDSLPIGNWPPYLTCYDAALDPSHYPNNLEGWGAIALDEGLYFAGETRQLRVWDVRNADGLEAGGEDLYNFSIVDDTETLKITMAFTDYPGIELADDVVVNDLHLIVEGPTGTYYGNWFDTAAGVAVTGGQPDPLNMIERVVIETPAIGDWTIRIVGNNVPMGPQGYGLTAVCGFESVPSLMTSFHSESGEGVVTLEWDVSEPASSADFRLEAVHVDSAVAREVEVAVHSERGFQAVDRDPSLVDGGEFIYSLSYNSAAGWVLLQRQTIEVGPAPAVDRILGAFPNPFNPKTTIRFTLSAAGETQIVVYDVAGRQVAELFDGYLEHGEREVDWFGKDDRNEAVASGVYFVKLRANGATDTRRLVLIR
ncbi:MAG: S8 family serine peptidase [bacterium]|nr:S8 family serine peptidase [bacterium]